MKIDSKTLKPGVSTIVITSLLLLFVGSITQAQQEGANALFDTWYLDTYEVHGEQYAPSKKEKDDYILFKEDMTFVSRSEGKKEEGSFFLNSNGAYVLLSYENGDKLKVHIISLSMKSLIVTYDFNAIRDVEVHYNRKFKILD